MIVLVLSEHHSIVVPSLFALTTLLHLLFIVRLRAPGSCLLFYSVTCHVTQTFSFILTPLAFLVSFIPIGSYQIQMSFRTLYVLVPYIADLASAICSFLFPIRYSALHCPFPFPSSIEWLFRDLFLFWHNLDLLSLGYSILRFNDFYTCLHCGWRFFLRSLIRNFWILLDVNVGGNFC